MTEQRNPRAARLAQIPVRELLELMSEEDASVPVAVRRALPEVEAAVHAIVDALRSGGRLRYVGAGTSGRLGVLDASEAPPTFGVDPDLVRGIIAGGDRALRHAAEAAEDDPAAGARDVGAATRAGDVVVGISASGKARYVLGGLEAARGLGARTIGLTCDGASALARAPFVEIAIVIAVGPEVLAGSTRLKAGTATKLVLNMLSTAAMVRLGRTKGDLMVDLRAASMKLRARAVGIVAAEAGVSEEEARRRLEACAWDVRRAIGE